jgi:hypothetical protein
VLLAWGSLKGAASAPIPPFREGQSPENIGVKRVAPVKAKTANKQGFSAGNRAGMRDDPPQPERLRRPTLYPTELRALVLQIADFGALAEVAPRGSAPICPSAPFGTTAMQNRDSRLGGSAGGPPRSAAPLLRPPRRSLAPSSAAARRIGSPARSTMRRRLIVDVEPTGVPQAVRLSPL